MHRREHRAAPLEPAETRFLLGIALASLLLCGLLAWAFYDLKSFESDGTAYLFQAQLFARGELFAPEPPELGFSSSPHLNIHDGKWYSKYAPGTSLALVPGVWLGAPWVVPVLCTVLSLVLLYLLVRELFGRRVAVVATLLGLLSPATLTLGATWLSEPVNRLLLALFLYALVRAVRRGEGGYALLAGFALGFALNTRPLTAIAFGLGAGLVTLATLIPSGAWRQRLRPALLFALPLLAWVGVTLLYNSALTGHPLRFTHGVMQPNDRIGFGKRSEGYAPALAHAVEYTPGKALLRVGQYVLPCVLYNTLGWGRYHSSQFRFAGGNKGRAADPAPIYMLKVLPLGLTLALVVAGFVPRRTRRRALALLMLLGLNLVAYGLFYYDGSTWGWTPVNARYYAASIFLVLVPLAALGGVSLHALLWPKIATPGKAALILLALALLGNTTYTYVRIGAILPRWSDVYQTLPRLVKAADIHRAVVFIQGIQIAPLGSYPGTPLEQADVVYFKLGPLPQWKLQHRDWRVPYNAYFKGRRAYLYRYRSGKLVPLRP